jgi:hypothetical protein
MRKLLLRPNSAGYAVVLGNEIVSINVDGGPSRSRRDFLGKPSMVNVAWMLDQAGSEYLNAFFRTATANGSLPFLCDLLLDRSTLEEYTCKFVPGSFKPIGSTAAFTFNAIASFEVQPLPVNAELDTEIMDSWEMTRNFDSLLALSNIANIYMPENL